MLEQVTTYIERHHLLPEDGEVVVVAVSGGADSLCLLHLLHRLCGPGKRYPALRLRAAHLNHLLRAEVGTQQATELTQLVTSWGLPSVSGAIDVPALALQERRSLEDAARVARYRFLRSVAEGAPIAVGHHADDQLETLLLHWLRGGGLAGLVGMQPRQQDIIRPLLDVTHAETVAYCQQYGLTPFEDASNSDLRFVRNRIRHELLPLLTGLNPGISDTLRRNAEVLRVDLDWVETQVAVRWPMVVVREEDARISLKLHALLALPLSLQRHLLRHVAARLCAGQSPLEPRHYALLEQLARRSDSVGEPGLDLPQTLRVTRRPDELVFERVHPADSSSVTGQPVDDELALLVPGEGRVPGTSWLARAELLVPEVEARVRQALLDEEWAEVWRLLPPARQVVYIDGDCVESRLWVRTRRPGDRVRPLGLTYEKKVQDVLVNKRVPRSERASVPLFFSRANCLWLAGVCLDDRVRLTPQTRHIVRLSIEPV